MEGLAMGMDTVSKTTRPPTARQLEILGFIRDFIAEYGYAPSIRDVGANLGINSPNGVMCHVKALERKGLLVRDSQTARSFRLPGTWDAPPTATTEANGVRVTVPGRLLTMREARELASTLLELTS